MVQALSGIDIERTETEFLQVPEMTDILRYAFEEYEPARPDLVLPDPVSRDSVGLGSFKAE